MTLTHANLHFQHSSHLQLAPALDSIQYRICAVSSLPVSHLQTLCAHAGCGPNCSIMLQSLLMVTMSRLTVEAWLVHYRQSVLSPVATEAEANKSLRQYQKDILNQIGNGGNWIVVAPTGKLTAD